ncbi:NAD(P)/FAD-dependent oxidoreductase [Clostridium tagluense]|uniref:NAD(P)/FAD-dependent oxidoreductase n=1 Tax=Clostridium tagluense TaxID=360422 RepID=UPI001CF1A435|nr:NAD(P)/FAD-dependent oxidoreductase [Clostridium tagluense]MCB2313809.1 NAD(P)/FAD-dependent oxidoreductase [Clostridium tagluense]MCB2318641.1 NAD(P)/FAD-dependent oxidoreductase [Clostridium tagluense]MCB2323516.1 NAD(P)/FAD-dependent oxidoreductase [Clostridium tagluense]MCB2328385.1 NAD(P)/FAD-dependent oxidoreductase [Clostridium tagluense]MCB2333223.1 NAD(P)/FAD-dependent oxidoreductase [Clostridium tagluense]
MFDVTIIGAGIVGCSISRELSKYNLKTCVLDKSSDVGSGTSKANSAIVHAGHDADPSTLKGKLNALGNAMYTDLAMELDFPFKRNGSLVLCFDKQHLGDLENLLHQGEKNGVPGLVILTGDQVREMEPNITKKCVAALYAPTGGIVCPYEMTIAMAENAYNNGVKFEFETGVIDIEKKSNNYIIKTNKGIIETKIIINAAGLFSDEINNMISDHKFKILPKRGEYVLFDKAVGDLVTKTIFQLPTKLGKGVLVTPTVDGNLLVGPDAVDVESKDNLCTTKEGIDDILLNAGLSIQEPLPMNMVITSFAGNRAKNSGNDFIIGEAIDAKNFINVASIDSPGLTSAPSIAVMVADIVIGKLTPEKNSEFNPIRQGIRKFREMSNEERKEIIKEIPEYGKIICRCETVTEGEIIDSIRRPLGATTLDGVKRRTRAGMGRCQSGFCATRVVDILSKELNIPRDQVTKSGGNSILITGKNKDLL